RDCDSNHSPGAPHPIPPSSPDLAHDTLRSRLPLGAGWDLPDVAPAWLIASGRGSTGAGGIVRNCSAPSQYAILRRHIFRSINTLPGGNSADVLHEALQRARPNNGRALIARANAIAKSLIYLNLLLEPVVPLTVHA